MEIIFYSEKLGQEIERKKNLRGEISTRKAAKQIGVSSSTLSRVINGTMPDIVSFLKICNWLQVAPVVFYHVNRDKPIG